MEVLFITVMSIIIVFFVARLAVELYFQSSAGLYYKSFVVEILRYASLVMYIIMAIMLALSLELMEVFTGMEVKLTFYSLGTVGVLYIVERAFHVYKTSDKVTIRSGVIDFKHLSKLKEFEGLIKVSDNMATLDKSRLSELDELLITDSYNHCKLSPNKTFLLKVIELLLPILLATIILTAGVVLAK